MGWLCRLGFHRWRYHGYPVEERRRCITCPARQWFVGGRWADR